MNNERKVAVVTGSYKGLGLEIAKQLGKFDNIQVIITSRDEEKGLESQQKLEHEGLKFDYHQLDVIDDKSVAEFTKWLQNKYARVDILVNNAGVNPNTQSEESSVLTAKLDTVISTFSANLVGALRMCQALIPLMKEANYGRIVNVSTEMACLNYIKDDYYPISPSYRLSKIALNGLACLLAKELKDTNILINNYSPGWMKTDIGGASAPFTPEEGAETAVYLATLPDDGSQGGFFAETRKFGGPFALPW